MKSRCLPWVTITCIVVAVDAPGLWAIERNDGVEAKFRAMGEEYDRLVETAYAEPSNDQPQYTRDITDEDWLKLYYEQTAKPSPDSQMLPRFLAFAENHSESPLAFDSLAFAIRRGGPATGELHGVPWRIKEQAIEVVMNQHMDDPRIAYIFDMLSGSIPSERTELLLREGLEKSTDPCVRAAAGFALARCLHHRSRYHRRSSQLEGQETIGNSLDRHWKLIVAPYLQENFRYDHEKVSAEIDRLLTHLASDYSDVEASDWEGSGPGNIFLRTVDQEEAKTYGDLARSLMRERSKLAPGKKAPDIIGRDASGEQFQLSDYEGKVVLLTFSANWCAPCKRLYPLQRDLVDRFRDERFVLLSVSRDESVDTLKASLASDEITWRCWWDGLEGPIGALIVSPPTGGFGSGVCTP
ncbi:MAG: redoxin domain-containing protein, partial [Candidatus Paceibacterota bacterium]